LQALGPGFGQFAEEAVRKALEDRRKEDSAYASGADE
jgi:hypothetical protein